MNDTSNSSVIWFRSPGIATEPPANRGFGHLSRRNFGLAFHIYGTV
jgi:hypothetical protein